MKCDGRIYQEQDGSMIIRWMSTISRGAAGGAFVPQKPGRWGILRQRRWWIGRPRHRDLPGQAALIRRVAAGLSRDLHAVLARLSARSAMVRGWQWKCLHAGPCVSCASRRRTARRGPVATSTSSGRGASSRSGGRAIGAGICSTIPPRLRAAPARRRARRPIHRNDDRTVAPRTSKRHTPRR